MANKKPKFVEPTFEELDPQLLKGLEKMDEYVEEIETRNIDNPRAGEMMRKNLDVTLSFRLGARDRRALDLLAQREGKKTGDLAREFILKGLAEYLRQEEILEQAKKDLTEKELEKFGLILSALQEQFHQMVHLSASAEGALSSMLHRTQASSPGKNRNRKLKA